MAGQPQAGNNEPLRPAVAAEAGRVGPEAFQRGTDVARVALRSAVPDGPLNLARIDAERCPPVVVARTEAVVRVSVGASGQERSEAEG